MSNHEIENEPIFIFAASWRTGSTLLQRVLNASENVFVYGEPGFISNARMLFERNEDYLQKVSWNRENNKTDKQGQWIPIFNPPVENLYKAFQCYFTSLYNLSSIGIEENKKWGFKEVRDNAYEDSKFLKKIFPKAKFLFLIRNPFDMYISLKGQDAIFNNFKDDKPLYPVEVWNRNVSFFLDHTKINEVGGLVIKYEDLVDNKTSQETLDNIVEYLDIEYNEKMLSELSMKAGQTTVKNPLTKDEVEKIFEIIKENNKELNYTISDDKIKKSKWFS